MISDKKVLNLLGLSSRILEVTLCQFLKLDVKELVILLVANLLASQVPFFPTDFLEFLVFRFENLPSISWFSSY